MEIIENSVCPIAGLAGSPNCLGSACPWHSPPAGCLIREMKEALLLLVSDVSKPRTTIRQHDELLKGKAWRKARM
jgi:hypothetical protein